MNRNNEIVDGFLLYYNRYSRFGSLEFSFDERWYGDETSNLHNRNMKDDLDDLFKDWTT